MEIRIREWFLAERLKYRIRLVMNIVLKSRVKMVVFAKGTLKKTEFAGRIYLRGEWISSGGNNAMWGTGLCCNGRIELYRDKAKKNQLKIKGAFKRRKMLNTAIAHSHFKLGAGKKFVLKMFCSNLVQMNFYPKHILNLILTNVLRRIRICVISLEGHTDIDGPHRQNKKLSKKRKTGKALFG
ncbi:MAG: hypothetical protein IPP64_14720 [Bacteroidetes bacterium]|nr:hypothetical protein [Bacteroidota bacterium]